MIDDNNEMMKSYTQSLLHEAAGKGSEFADEEFQDTTPEQRGLSHSLSVYDKDNDLPGKPVNPRIFDAIYNDFRSGVHNEMLKLADTLRGSWEGIIWDAIDEMMDEPQIKNPIKRAVVGSLASTHLGPEDTLDSIESGASKRKARNMYRQDVSFHGQRDYPDTKVPAKEFPYLMHQLRTYVYRWLQEISDTPRGSYEGVIWSELDAILNTPQVLAQIRAKCMDDGQSA